MSYDQIVEPDGTPYVMGAGAVLTLKPGSTLDVQPSDGVRIVVREGEVWVFATGASAVVRLTPSDAQAKALSQ